MGSNITAVPEGGIFEVFKAIDRGDFVLELEEKSRELVEAIRATGKGGKLSIELELAPDKDGGLVKVFGSVKAKTPKPKPKAAYFFMTPEGNLSRMDTRQRSMFPEDDQ